MTETELTKIRDEGIAATKALREIEHAREVEENEAKELFRLIGGYKECDLDVFNRAWSELYGALPKIPRTLR